VHGLAGSDASSNVVATGLLAFSQGYHVFRMNMRGAGDSLPFCPLLYNAGLDQDVIAVLGAVAKELPRIFLAGFSLGGNLVLLALGRLRESLPKALVAAGAVSPPLDLLASTRAIARRQNVFYERHFVGELRRGYRARQRLRPDLFEPGREARAKSIYVYDDIITAPYGGFESAEEYYARSSSGPWLASITTPSLILAADDDPMIPVSSILGYPLPSSGLARREILKTGGHVGYFARTQAPGRFWAAERLLAFFSPY
jgi:predicted alpha/beta-fold hydrolase